MKAYVFPGQGAQFTGMGHELYEQNPKAKELMDRADAVLGFKLTDIMFSGSEDDLKQTKVTQPAVFLHSVVLALTDPEFAPDMTAGHSLGEFSALVAAGALDFESGLKLVSARAQAMQKACEAHPSTMAAVLALPDEKVEEICAEVPGCVRAANYNCPGQVVISGTVESIEAACEKMLAAGAKRALKLKVGAPSTAPLWSRRARNSRPPSAPPSSPPPAAPSTRTLTASPTPTPKRSRRTSLSSSRPPCAGPRACSRCSPTAPPSSWSSAPAPYSRASSRKSTARPRSADVNK